MSFTDRARLKRIKMALTVASAAAAVMAAFSIHPHRRIIQMKNLKTTAAGVAALVPFLMYGLHLINPDIPGPDLSTAWASAATAWGLFVARDSGAKGT